MVLPIKLKLDMCITDHRSSHYINFGLHRKFYRMEKLVYIMPSRFKIFEVHFSIVKRLEVRVWKVVWSIYYYVIMYAIAAE